SSRHNAPCRSTSMTWRSSFKSAGTLFFIPLIRKFRPHCMQRVLESCPLSSEAPNQFHESGKCARGGDMSKNTAPNILLTSKSRPKTQLVNPALHILKHTRQLRRDQMHS